MIKISDAKLQKAALASTKDFLHVFTDAYLYALQHSLDSTNMHLLNSSQHTLLAYHFLHEEVMQGGFIQLIQNGYGGYIFGNPVAKALKQMGASELAKVIYKAKEIYDSNRDELERETTDEEFMAMCADFQKFDELDEYFFEIEEHQTAIIAKFVDEHIEEFGQIVKP